MTGDKPTFDQLRNVRLRVPKIDGLNQILKIGWATKIIMGNRTYYFPDGVTKQVDADSDPENIWVTCTKSTVRDLLWDGDIFDLSGAPVKKFDL